MAHQNNVKLSEHVDFDETNRSCAGIEIGGCCLLRDIGLSTGQNDPSFCPLFSTRVHPIERKLFSHILSTIWDG